MCRGTIKAPPNKSLDASGGACFASSLVRRRLIEIAPPRQLNRAFGRNKHRTYLNNALGTGVDGGKMMKRMIRIATGLALGVAGAWAAIATTSLIKQRRRLAFADCPVTDPECHGTVGTVVEVERPTGMEFVLDNEFLLKGSITNLRGRKVDEAKLVIQGRFPSSDHITEIDLMNGKLGSVVRPEGGPFIAMVSNELFCSVAQVVPYRNVISVFVRDSAGNQPREDPGGCVINLSCLFTNLSGPATQ